MYLKKLTLINWFARGEWVKPANTARSRGDPVLSLTRGPLALREGRSSLFT